MRKENIILGSIFLILLVLAFVFEPIMEWKKNLGRPDNFFEDIKFDEVTKINIEKNGENISLEKQGEKWKLSGTKDFSVREVDAIFTSYMGEAIEADFDLVGNNKEKKSEFETDEKGARVSLQKGDKTVADFIVGKMTSDFAGSYISLPEGDETYKVGANLSYSFNKDVKSWYDLSVFSLDKEVVNKIRFQYPNSEFTLEKIDGAWKGVLPYPFSVDEEKVNEIVETMTSLNASSIPAQTFDGTGLEKHLIIVEASGEGIQNTLMIGDANEDKEFFAKKGDSDNVYLISSEDKDTLQTTIQELR